MSEMLRFNVFCFVILGTPVSKRDLMPMAGFQGFLCSANSGAWRSWQSLTGRMPQNKTRDNLIGSGLIFYHMKFCTAFKNCERSFLISSFEKSFFAGPCFSTGFSRDILPSTASLQRSTVQPEAQTWRWVKGKMSLPSVHCRLGWVNELVGPTMLSFQLVKRERQQW